MRSAVEWVQVVAVAIGLAMGLSITGAHAQRAVPHGVAQAFAMVQAPEAAVETCHADTSRAALDCARAKCARKAGRGACFSIAVCSPSGWAGVMGIKVTEVHFSETVCGAPTKDALIAALKAFCVGHLVNLEQCYVGQIWGPNGKAEKVELTWTAAALRDSDGPQAPVR